MAPSLNDPISDRGGINRLVANATGLRPRDAGAALKSCSRQGQEQAFVFCF
jgi:hypothetical protein